MKVKVNTKQIRRVNNIRPGYMHPEKVILMKTLRHYHHDRGINRPENPSHQLYRHNNLPPKSELQEAFELR